MTPIQRAIYSTQPARICNFDGVLGILELDHRGAAAPIPKDPNATARGATSCEPLEGVGATSPPRSQRVSTLDRLRCDERAAARFSSRNSAPGTRISIVADFPPMTPMDLTRRAGTRRWAHHLATGDEITAHQPNTPTDELI